LFVPSGMPGDSIAPIAEYQGQQAQGVIAVPNGGRMGIIKDVELIGYQLAIVWSGVAVGTVVGFWLGVIRERIKR